MIKGIGHIGIAVIEFGPVSLELLAEIGPDGILSGPVEEREDFIHHLSLITDAIDLDIAELEAKGVKMA